MWTKIRAWKHAIAPPLAVIALVLMREFAELTVAWSIGFALAVLLGVAYVGEEIFWNLRRGGRTCASCGERYRVRSFRFQDRCPHCGAEL
jgi:hypothetical protein